MFIAILGVSEFSCNHKNSVVLHLQEKKDDFFGFVMIKSQINCKLNVVIEIAKYHFLFIIVPRPSSEIQQ
jgi:hypothetical protein